MRGKLTVVLLCAVWGAGAAQSLENPSPQVQIGSQIPHFALPDSSARIQDSKQWLGKVMVINFWATWCAPCLKEMPMFNQTQKDFAEDGVVFIGIAVDSAANVNKFLEKVRIDYPILVGDMEGLKLVVKYGNRAGTLPYTVFVDRQGRIASIANGLLSRSETMEQLEKLL